MSAESALPLPGAYALLNRLPAEVVQQSRRLVYTSVANSVKATRPKARRAPCNFGIGVTFARPIGDGIDSFVSALHLVPEVAYRDENPLLHTIEALKLERATQFTSRMSAGFREVQRQLGSEASLIAVHAVFGLREPVDIGWEAGAGAMALVHTANGTSGVALVGASGELLQAAHAHAGSTLDFNGVRIDLAEDLGLLYDTLTADEAELDLLS